MALACALALSAPLAGADRTWVGGQGQRGGDGISFGDPMNWSPNGVPGVLDRARFIAAGGPVQFGGGLIVNDRLLVDGAFPTVVLDLDGTIYRLNSGSSSGAARSLLIGDTVSGHLVVTDGTVVAKHGSIGAGSNASGVVEVFASGSFQATSSLLVGESGAGLLQVLGEAITGDLTLGRFEESSGSVDVLGNAGLLLVFGDLDTGEGSAQFDVAEGALVAVLGELRLGTVDSPGVEFLVTGLGTTLLVDGDIVLGDADVGEGTFTVEDGALVRGSAFSVGESVEAVLTGGRLDATTFTSSEGATTVGENGTLVINGPDADVANGIFAGFSGTPVSISLDEAATLSTPRLVLGAVPGSSVGATATGQGTEILVLGDAFIGWLPDGANHAGGAELEVEAGAALEVQGTLVLRDGGRLELSGPSASAYDFDMSEGRSLLVGGFEDTPTGTLLEVNGGAALGGGMYIGQADPFSSPALGTVLPAVDAVFIDGQIDVVLARALPGLKYYRALPYGVSKDSSGASDSVAFEVAKLEIAVALAEVLPVELPGVPNLIVAGFFDDDSLPDVFVTIPGTDDAPGLGALLINTGSAAAEGGPAFIVAATIGLGTDPSGLAQSDFDGDTVPDFVVSNAGDGTLQVILNVPDKLGVASGLAPGTTLSVGGRPRSVMAADLRNTDLPDLVWVDDEAGVVSTVPNDGKGGFGPVVKYASGAQPSSVCPLDLDNDKDIDLAVTNGGQVFGGFGGSAIGIHLNQAADGGEGFAAVTLYPVGDGVNGIAEGDLDGDGVPDIVTADGASATVSVLIGVGDGTFKLPVTLPTGGFPKAIAAGDLDSDDGKDLDIAVIVETEQGHPALSLFRNDTENGHLVLTILEDAQALLGLPLALTTADTDGDGPTDLLFIGDGGPGREGEGFVSVVKSVPIICPADFNGDGAVDGGDIGTLLADFGMSGSTSDLNQDGIVNEVDLLLLLEGFGSCKGGED